MKEVFEQFSVTTNGKYFLCLYVVDDGKNACKAKLSHFTGSPKRVPSRVSDFKKTLTVFPSESVKICTWERRTLAVIQNCKKKKDPKFTRKQEL